MWKKVKSSSTSDRGRKRGARDLHEEGTRWKKKTDQQGEQW